jgi:hypothetical protein
MIQIHPEEILLNFQTVKRHATLFVVNLLEPFSCNPEIHAPKFRNVSLGQVALLPRFQKGRDIKAS